MTATEMAMNDESPAIGGQALRIALIVLASFGTLFAVGLFAGLIAGQSSRGARIDLVFVAELAGAMLLAGGCLYGGWRAFASLTRAAGRPTDRERRNRLVLTGCMLMGGVIGMVLTLAGPRPEGMFSSDPIPAPVAIALAVLIALVLPFVSYYWHRHVVDEQEEAAYNRGALVGISVYFMGAPAWWLLWRGGLLPAPDGIAIYFVTIAVTGIVWIWAKYR